MTKLKILYVPEYYDPRFLSDWVEIPRGLSRRGHDVTVLSPSVGRDDTKKNAEDHYENENLRVIHRNYLELRSPFSAARMRFYPPLISGNYDVVHANNLFVASNFPLILSRLMRRCDRSIINTEIESRWVQRSVDRFAPWMRVLDKAFVSAFHCASDSGGQFLLSFGIGSEKIWVIPQGVDFGHFQRVKRSDSRDGSITIGFVGRMSPQKGLDRVASVLLKLMNEDTRVRVLFAGPIPPVFERYARDLLGRFQGKERFKYIGYVSDVRSFLADIDIFLMPTREEATAKTPLEVMAAGRPIVASDIMPLTDYIESGKNGFLAHTPEEFYSQLKLLCDSEDLRNEIGDEARKKASTHDWEMVLDRIESMYEARSKNYHRVSGPPPGRRLG